ncbi:PH domain-containing protein [Skermania piniformis]|uniref:PH domain-containing protein n=1 Tax=Skermania pinensis TaxID=39122 RepID=UPI001FEAF7E7|nr:PH domain-containing protein [Skermania piniformis]
MAALVATTLGAVVFVVAAVLTRADPAGALLLTVAALGTTVVAALGWLRRPRLAVYDGPDGTADLAVRELRGTSRFGRAELAYVRVSRYPRLGRRIPLLEIELRESDRLLVFGRWDLGADPAEVLDALTVHGLVPTD